MLTAHRGARTALCRARSGDDGFTLAEMLVTMIIASIVGALVFGFFMGAGSTATATTDSSHTIADARNALQAWAKDLQVAGSPTVAGSGAGRIISLSATSIDFYAHLDNVPCTNTSAACPTLSTTEVTLSLTGHNLVEKIGTAASSVVVPGGVVTAGTCLFTAYAGSTSLGCGSGLTRAQLDSVTGVTLAFTATPASGHARSYTTSATFTTYSNTGGTSGAPLS